MPAITVCLLWHDTSCAHFCAVVQVELWKTVLAPVVGDRLEFSIPYNFNMSVTYAVVIGTSSQ